MTSNYSQTQVTVNGQIYNAGDVLRVLSAGRPFDSAVILGFDDHYAMVRLARPYAVASNVGTTGPNVMTGVEVYDIYVSSLPHYEILDTGRLG